MATRDKSHLEWHGRQWRVTVFVPRQARPMLGKAHLKHPLGTPHLDTANFLKHEHVTRFKRLIEEAMREAVPGDTFDEARAIRVSRAVTPKRVSVQPDLYDEHRLAMGVEVVEDDEAFYAVERAYEIEEERGEDAANAFLDVALSRATPLTEHLEAFIGDWNYQPKSVLELRRAVRWLGEWLKAHNKADTLEAIDQAAASGFMRDLVHRRLLDRKNAGKYISFLRTYWGWLEEHEHRPPASSPWLAKLPKAKAQPRHSALDADPGKRPYTDDELLALLEGKPKAQVLPDLIRIAALSGMRIEEIYRLRVRDCAGGFFDVRTGKTKNAVRRVPVHAQLERVVARLVMGKDGLGYLIDHRAPVSKQTGIRSSAASKAFTRYRRTLALDERPNDKAKSNIDFHSLRRWFIKKARDALEAGALGFAPWTIADVVGHDDEGMKNVLRLTMSHYPGPSGDDARNACVAAVTLPKRPAN